MVCHRFWHSACVIWLMISLYYCSTLSSLCVVLLKSGNTLIYGKHRWHLIAAKKSPANEKQTQKSQPWVFYNCALQQWVQGFWNPFAHQSQPRVWSYSLSAKSCGKCNICLLSLCFKIWRKDCSVHFTHFCKVIFSSTYAATYTYTINSYRWYTCRCEW